MEKQGQNAEVLYGKVIKSGDFVRLLSFVNPMDLSAIRQSRARRPSSRPKGASVVPCVRSGSSLARSKRRLRYLVECSARRDDPMPIFLTLTFAYNLRDLATANRLFRDGMRRISYAVYGSQNKLKYVAVPEFQKRGAVHYHAILFGIGFMPDLYDKAARAWGHGFVWVRGIDPTRVSVVSSYLVKYLYKSFGDGRLFSKRVFLCSKNLPREEVVRLFAKVFGPAGLGQHLWTAGLPFYAGTISCYYLPGP